jgi:hypothetical protein
LEIERNDMTRDEIVTALRCCVSVAPDCCKTCPAAQEDGCEDAIKFYAADLIENQQRHIEALLKANDSLKDAIARRDKQIEDMKQGMAQLAKAVAVKEEKGVVERLTVPDVRVDEHTTRRSIIDGNAVREHAMEIYWRLKDYEDTGLTPGDIKELLDMAVSKTDKVLRLKEELHTIKNELCQYCGKYKQAHEGACDGCRWREM